MDPGWTAEQKLQTRDINDLAIDMADFIEQTAKHQPRKKKSDGSHRARSQNMAHA